MCVSQWVEIFNTNFRYSMKNDYASSWARVLYYVAQIQYKALAQ